MNNRKKVLIADDHAIFREGLKKVIATSDDMCVVDEATNGPELLRKVMEQEFNLVVLDVSMPGRSGLDVLAELKAHHPSLPVVVLSMHPEEQYAIRAYRSGAAGYITKESPPRELLDALHKALAGKKYVSPAFAEALVSGLDSATLPALHNGLSNREFQIICLIASGRTVGTIARELSLSVKTVSTHRSNILRKMNLKNNSELTRYAIENHLI